MARLRFTRSDWLLAKTCACEFAACSTEAVCPACSLATTSVQRVSAWISRSLFSVTNAAPSLLVTGCAPSQFGYSTESLFGQSSCLRPVPEHNRQKSSVAQQVHAPWPNCWHLKQRLGRGVYGFTSNLSNGSPKMCSGRVGASKVRKNVPLCTFLPPLVMITLLVSFTWGESLLRQVSGKFLIRQDPCSLFESDYSLDIILHPVGWDLERHVSNLVQFHQIGEVSQVVDFH